MQPLCLSILYSLFPKNGEQIFRVYGVDCSACDQSSGEGCGGGGRYYDGAICVANIIYIVLF